MVKRINSLRSLSKFIMLSILIVIVYTINEFIFSIICGVSHDVLTTCVFGLFGTELAACGFIKIFKIKKEETQ